MVALKAHLNNLVLAEVYKFGKANKILTAAEFEALKEAGTEEEAGMGRSMNTTGFRTRNHCSGTGEARASLASA